MDLASRSWNRVAGSGFGIAAPPAGLSPVAPVRLEPGRLVHDTAALCRAQGCLLGQLAGDSLGALVEFQSAGSIAHSYPDGGPRELADGGPHSIMAGQPTTTPSWRSSWLGRLCARVGSMLRMSPSLYILVQRLAAVRKAPRPVPTRLLSVRHWRHNGPGSRTRAPTGPGRP